MTQPPTLAQLIKQAIDNRLLDMHTALIAKVESYDAQKQQVNVSPVLKRRIKTLAGNWMNEQLPVLCDVPVLFPRAGGYFITFPLKPGDFVQLIFNEADIAEFLTDAAAQNAPAERFSLQGAVAIPGFLKSANDAEVFANSLVIGSNAGPQIHIDSEKIRLGSEKADEALALASLVKAELEKIRSAFALHTHSSHFTPTTSQITPTGDIATKKVVAE